MDKKIVKEHAQMWYKSICHIDNNCHLVPAEIFQPAQDEYKYLRVFVLNETIDIEKAKSAVKSIKKIESILRMQEYREFANVLKDFYPICNAYYLGNDSFKLFQDVLKEEGWFPKKVRDRKTEKEPETKSEANKTKKERKKWKAGYFFHSHKKKIIVTFFSIAIVTFLALFSNKLLNNNRSKDVISSTSTFSFNKDILTGTYSVKQNGSHESMQMYAEIKEVQDGIFSVKVHSDLGSQSFSFSADADGKLVSDKLGNGVFTYKEKLDKKTLVFTDQNRMVWEFTR